MKILVCAAHPDDEVLGCGGTMARLVEEGNEVYIAILGEGITSRYDDREKVDSSLIDALHTRSQQVGKLIGAKEVFNYRLPDNQFDSVPLIEIVKIIENLIERLKPEVVYTQHGGDLNIDHNLVYRATLTATRPLAGCVVREVLAYEVASSTEWAFQQFEPAFRPNVFVDISRTIETKIRGMEIYESEARAFPHPRSPEALRAIARRWGSVVGADYAEAFSLVRLLK
ncbi:MAG: PIG-L deacetylase family protein [Pyrinomonadaceae bacterium]